jgi:hypothetical protein
MMMMMMMTTQRPTRTVLKLLQLLCFPFLGSVTLLLVWLLLAVTTIPCVDGITVEERIFLFYRMSRDIRLAAIFNTVKFLHGKKKITTAGRAFSRERNAFLGVKVQF